MLIFQVFNPKSTPEDHILENMVNLKQIKESILQLSKNKKVILLGEAHTIEKLHQFIADMLPTLKENGYTHMVSEMSRGQQVNIDRYFNNEITLSQLKDNIGVPTDSTHYDYNLYLIKKCKENGIKVVCVDDFSGKKGDRVGQLGSRPTDEQLFDRIQEIIPKNTKFLVNYGSFHTQYNSNEFTGEKHLGQLFKDKYGAEVLSIRFVATGNELKIGEEGGFFSSVMGDKKMERRAIFREFFFKDYDIFINIDSRGTLSEKDLGLEKHPPKSF